MKARDIYNAVVTWSTTHTNAAWFIAGLVVGFILRKAF